jgi:hypothetical protein
MRGSHLGMRTPRMGGGVVNAEFARPRANGGQETMRGSHLGMRTPRMGGALSTRSSHAHGRTAARRRCAVRIWGCELRGWGGRCQRGVRTPTGERRPGDDARFASGDANSADGGGVVNAEFARPRCERRPGDDARFASGDANSADGGGVVNAEFARPRANGGQETMRGSHLGMRTPRMGGGVVNAEFARPRANGGQETMRGSHLGMRTPRMGGALSTRSSHAHGRTAARRRCAVRIWGCELRGWGGRCQRGVRTPTGERRPGDDARFASGDANSADGGGRCQRGVRTPTGERRPGDDARFASGDANSADGGGVVNAEFARPRANDGQETMRGSHLGMRTPRMGGGCCQRGVRTPTGERRPGDDARFASGDANSADGGGRCQRGVRTPTGERRPGDDARFASGDANSADGGGVVNAEFARPRANGGQETMRGSHLGMRTPRMGGGCQRGVRTPTGERRPGDDARFASGDANSADGGGVVNAEFARPRANDGQETMRGSHLGMRTPRMGGVLSTRSSHAHGRTAARRRCAVRIWGCELRGWGGALSTRSSHAHGRTAARRRCAVRIWGCELRGWGGALSTRSSHAHGRTAARRRCAVRIWGCELRGWGGRCQRGVRTPTGERRPGDDARFASGDANSADGGGVVNAEFARPRANGGQETMRGSHLGMRTPRMGGALSTRSSHAHGRTAARRRCAVRIWGCELRGWGGVLSTRSSHAHVRTAVSWPARCRRSAPWPPA